MLSSMKMLSGVGITSFCLRRIPRWIAWLPKHVQVPLDVLLVHVAVSGTLALATYPRSRPRRAGRVGPAVRQQYLRTGPVCALSFRERDAHLPPAPPPRTLAGSGAAPKDPEPGQFASA